MGTLHQLFPKGLPPELLEKLPQRYREDVLMSEGKDWRRELRSSVSADLALTSFSDEALVAIAVLVDHVARLQNR